MVWFRNPTPWPSSPLIPSRPNAAVQALQAPASRTRRKRSASGWWLNTIHKTESFYVITKSLFTKLCYILIYDMLCYFNLSCYITLWYIIYHCLSVYQFIISSIFLVGESVTIHLGRWIGGLFKFLQHLHRNPRCCSRTGKLRENHPFSGFYLIKWLGDVGGAIWFGDVVGSWTSFLLGTLQNLTRGPKQPPKSLSCQGPAIQRRLGLKNVMMFCELSLWLVVIYWNSSST